MAPLIEKHLPNGVSVTVRNVPGADGQIAGNQMYAAEPDGTQIQVFNFTGLVAGQLSGEAEYDLGEFTYLGRLTSDPQVVSVAGDSEIDTIEELRQEAPIKQSLAGFTSSDGVTAVVLCDTLGIEYTPVLHGEGGGEQRLSVLRGDTDAVINSLESVFADV